jgi:hypothetical protein
MSWVFFRGGLALLAMRQMPQNAHEFYFSKLTLYQKKALKSILEL